MRSKGSPSDAGAADGDNDEDEDADEPGFAELWDEEEE